MTQSLVFTERRVTRRAKVVFPAPPMAELTSAFDWVNPRFAELELEPVEVCQHVDRETRETEFELFELAEDHMRSRVTRELFELGMRPGLFEELLGLVREDAYRDGGHDPTLNAPIMAIGSIAFVMIESVVPFVSWDLDGCFLLLHLTSNEIPRGTQLIATRR